MTVPDEQPEFDPATWTPDKPWPRGYYKPVPRIVQIEQNVAREDAANPGGDNPAFRGFLWGLVALPLQGLGVSAAIANHFAHGLLHAAAQAVTPVPLFLFFALVLPTLLHVGIVAPAGAKAARSFTHGLAASVLMLAFVLFAVLLRPMLHAILHWLVWLLS